MRNKKRLTDEQMKVANAIAREAKLPLLSGYAVNLLENDVSPETIADWFEKAAVVVRRAINATGDKN